jgi:glutamate-1-semialdehyde 2,1-aminomutase
MDQAVQRFHEELNREYERRFPRSRAYHESTGRFVLDHTSHAIRWNEPFTPVVRRAEGAAIEDLDGHRILDYWQGHFANIHGHNPALIREALAEAIGEGRGLQSGMLHEIEGEVVELICRSTGSETARLTTSGTLGTLYAIMLARAFTRRDRVLKVNGGWHGSQPFGLKGVVVRGASGGRLDSEGLWAGADEEIILTRFNDLEDLRNTFERMGDRIACFVVEPLLGAGGGMAASPEYLREARRLTEKHGALLLCDEIITAYRFRAGDCSTLYGVRPDLFILGKILGGGMPVAAIAGRLDVMTLCTRGSGRVKFEGGTYSAHELSLVAARAQLRHLLDHGDEVYDRLSRLGERMRQGIARIAGETGMPVHLLGTSNAVLGGSSLVFLHIAKENTPTPDCPEDLAERSHPRLGERLLKSTLMLEDVSCRSGLGAISTAHTEEDVERTLEGVRAAFDRFASAGLV